MYLLSSFERLYSNPKEASLGSAILMSAFMMLVYLAAIENFALRVFELFKEPEGELASAYMVTSFIFVGIVHGVLAHKIVFREKSYYESIDSSKSPALVFSAGAIVALFLSLALI